MNFKYSSILIFLIITSPLLGKIKISGSVIDAITNKPIEFSNVYINGSTHGTFTDSTGFYQLEDFEIPSLLIVTRIGYKTQSVYLKDKSNASINFNLIPKEEIVGEVNILDKDMRKMNLTYFKNLFLGMDVWGKYATIENENDIYFCKDYKTEEIKVANQDMPLLDKNISIIDRQVDSTTIAYQCAINFKATTIAPLKINLPLLGYTVFADLVYFYIDYNENHTAGQCAILGYYYFQPVKPASKRDSIRISKNRLKAYYNSSQHFFKSLYDKKLKENGYLTYWGGDLYSLDNRVEVNPDSLLTYKENYAEIINHKDEILKVVYFQQGDGIPKNLKKSVGYKPFLSKIRFLNDTCTIRSNGTMPDVSILLDGFFETKNVGAMLPDNFIPYEK
jgi:hypothetical protein